MNKLLSLCALLFAVSTQAGEIKVDKVKDGKAIVSFKGADLKVGDQLQVAGEGGEKSGSSSKGSFSRKWGISDYNFVYANLKPDSGSATTNFQLNTGLIKYNMGVMEFGAGYGFTTTSAGSAKASSNSLVLSFDYNLVPNKSGTSFVPYAGGMMSMSSSNSEKGSDLKLGGGVKWFPAGEIFALTGSIFYDSNSTESSGTTTKITGFALATGWTFYF